ncbi:MAG: hypothetical protein IKZ57_06075 [Spirochaetia bacterium]|nr:hypothetical protein [Spirochaetia bacterium]
MKYRKLFFLCMVLCCVFFFITCSNGSSSGDDDNTGITWLGSLPYPPNNPKYLWAYYNTTDECSYIWDGKKWTLLSGKSRATFDVKVVELTKKVVPFADPSIGFIELGFMDGKEDIPYIRCNSEFFENSIERNITVSSVNADTKKVTFNNREQNTTAELDLTRHTLTFDNYDQFFRDGNTVYFDAAQSNLGDYMKMIDYSNIAGQPVVFDWSAQDIGVVIWKEGNSYDLALPLQMFNDVFLSPSGFFILYNGNKLYLSNKLTDDYWTSGNQSGTRSKALAEFCYNELCLNLDFNYGLKAIHGIDKFPDFNTYFICSGIDRDLKSTNAITFATALKDVCEFFFDDGHSGYISNSHYLAKDAAIPGNHTSAKHKAMEDYYLIYKSLVRGESAPGYEVTSDKKTAIVRFDKFTNAHKNKADRADHDAAINGIIDSYAGTYENTYDTVSFIHYVNEQIKGDPKIENVVLDLSCNGGGANHAGAFVLAWMLGECTFNFTDSITGAKWAATYVADVDFDGNYVTDADAGDTIIAKNLFCLISPYSFSCANMVAAMLKASGLVTIIGVTSSGGSSVVQHSSTADGTYFQMSSKKVMSLNKNGSNYDIDRGVEPHYYISKPSNFYDKDKIEDLVNSINND